MSEGGMNMTTDCASPPPAPSDWSKAMDRAAEKRTAYKAPGA